MISAPSFAAAAVALNIMMCICHAAATDLTCSSDEMQMTTGLLTSCDDSDGFCETKCNSAACSGSGKLEYEYIIPVGGDLSIDCSATDGARCCLASFFEPLFGSIVNTGVQEIGGPTTCDATDEIMMTEGSLVFCNSTVYGTCFIECSDGCTVTSPNSEMTTMSYFATETPQGQDFEYDCNEEGSFCCVDMSDWAQAGPDTPATPETTPSGTDSAGTAPDVPVSTPSEPATPAVDGGAPPAPAAGPTSAASFIQSASLALLVAVGYCFVIIL